MAVWNLVWCDDFDGPLGSGPDPSVWNYDLGNSGWGNEEKQHYTDDPQNIRIIADPEASNGRALAITAIEHAPGCYTSARIHTHGKMEWTYGRFEARMKIPSGQGIWPALWLLGSDRQWPGCGEIDILEWIGRTPDKVYGTIHGPGYSGGNGVLGTRALANGDTYSGEYYVFAMEWSPRDIRWSVNDQVYHIATPDDLPAQAEWVYNHDFFLILNLAVGGRWPGNPDATTVFPQTFCTDYIRVYRHASI